VYPGERLNSITHLVGAGIAIVGLALLVVSASFTGDPWKIVSASIYGTTLVALYIFSTLYHSLRGENKRVFRKLDHTAIYLLIAGTYTPFTLVTLRGGWGWTLFGIVWSLAAVGMAQETLFVRRRRLVSVTLYLIMGWIIVIAAPVVSQKLELSALILLGTGGLFYTVGVLFYAFDKKIAHGHGIWHLFVAGGSLSHYMAVFLYVI
jgi:hemolysin III